MILGLDCSRYAADQPTGVEVYTNHVLDGVLDAVDQLGCTTVKCYVKTDQQLQRLLERSETQKKIQVVLIPRRRLWTLVGLSWELFRRPVDVFFEPSHTLPLCGAKQYVWTPHGMESDHFPEAYSVFEKALRKFSLWNAKRKKTHYIAITQAVKKDMVKFHHIDEQQITVIWNGFDAAIQENSKSHVGPQRGGIAGDYLLSVGRLEERKNQRRLIEAFDRIAADFPQLKLVLVGGDGYGADAVRDQVKQSPHQERIVVMGYQDDEILDQMRRGALVFAYPSLVEGFGIPILEAFAAETPVLTSQGGATEEVAGKAAVYCDPLSVDTIAQGLRKLLDDEDLRSTLIGEGKQRLPMFSWQRCAEQTVAVLQKYFS